VHRSLPLQAGSHVTEESPSTEAKRPKRTSTCLDIRGPAHQITRIVSLVEIRPEVE